MLYKIPKRKPRMSHEDQILWAVLALVGLPLVTCTLITLFV